MKRESFGQLRVVLLFLKTYKNFVTLLYMSFRGKYPIIAKLRNGSKVLITKHSQASLIALQMSNKFLLKIQYEKDMISFNYADRRIYLRGGFLDGDILGVFIKSQYRRLNVRDKIVIDIGANIGDSAIYFALNGAKKVIAIEPFPVTYNKLVENIKTNSLDNKITPINAVVSGKIEVLKLDPEASSTGSLKANKHENGTDVNSITIIDLLTEEGPYVLKMDCEGCEYDVFAALETNQINKFEEIIMEFHEKGSTNIISKLENYTVSVNGRNSGIIYAKKEAKAQGG